MNRRAVLYARLSIATDESVSIERQLEAGREYCQSQGWNVIGEHVDDGVSASASRPEDRRGWQAVLAHPPGTFDLVVVWKVDRLARRVLDFLNADQSLQARGAAIASVTDPIDMSTPTGRAFATMLAVFAEMEADAIRSRVKAARTALIRSGRVAGGAAPFGFLNAALTDAGGKALGGKVLAKDPEKIGYVIEAAGRVLRGDSLGSVCTWLDEVAPLTGRKNSAAYWTTTVTKRMLSNPVIAGMTSFNPGNESKVRGSDVLRDEAGMPVVREDLAVISIEEYRRLLSALAKTGPSRAASESYLSGIVWCGDCGRKMYRNAKNVRGHRVKVFQCQGKAGCGQQVSHLEEIVEERFLSIYGNVYSTMYRSTPTDYDHTEIDNQIAETLQNMGQDGVDVMALAERLQSLKALRQQQPQVQYEVTTSATTGAEDWAADPRRAILNRFLGVRLVRGRVGRKFDQNRLSFIEPEVSVVDTSSTERILEVMKGV